jgi:outer membrane immunogenic protein
MKKLLVSAFALAAFAGPAMAADLYTPVPSMYDWNGAYLGGHAGYLWGDASLRDDEERIGGDFDGVIGGIIGGWNFQSGNWIFGIEGDFGWTGADGVGGGCETGCDSDEVAEIYTYDMDWNAHVRGRAGITLGEDGRTLLFIAGGLAVADFQLGYEGEGRGGTYTGWSIGGGVNHAFSNNFIAGLEVLYDDYGSKTYEWESESYKVNLDAVTVRGTATYHFTY